MCLPMPPSWLEVRFSLIKALIAAQLVGHHSAKGMVASSIPGQGTWLGRRFSPHLGCI